MNQKWLLGCLLALMLAMPVGAEGVPCFQEASPEAAGVYVSGVPEEGGIYLGARQVQAGDVLTAEQMEQARYMGGENAAVCYRPIYDNRVEEEIREVLCKRNTPPVAEDMAVETYQNLPITEKLKVEDKQGDTMTYTVTRQPRRGTVTIAADGSFTYTPKKNKLGVDSFVFTASDDKGAVSREATVTVTILKPSDTARYTDTNGKPCQFAAEWMKNTGIFVAESVDGQCCFSPEKPVSKGDFLAMLVKVLQIPVETGVTETGFEEALPDWLRPYVAAAVRAGLPVGTEEFRPEDAITGAEAAALCPGLEGWEALNDEPLTRETAACMLYALSREAA